MGTKVFTNQLPASVSVILFGRQGDNPANFASTTSFTLAPNQTLTVEYPEVYVNGYCLACPANGELLTRQEVVTTRGSQLDNQWNTNSKFVFSQQSGNFIIMAHN